MLLYFITALGWASAMLNKCTKNDQEVTIFVAALKKRVVSVRWLLTKFIV